MYCPEGFITLYAVYDIFREYSWTNTPPSLELVADQKLRLCNPSLLDEVRTVADARTPVEEAEAYAKWLILSFIHEYTDEIRVALPSGNLVTIWRWIFAIRHPVFGPGDWDDDVDDWSFPQERQRRLNILSNILVHIEEMAFTIHCTRGNDPAVEIGLRHVHGCPLCVRKCLFPLGFDLVAHLEGKLKIRRLGYLEHAVKAKDDPLVAKIIDFVERTKATRDQTKAALGPDLKAEFWRALWREAARLRPDLRLNVPGPKGTRRS